MSAPSPALNPRVDAPVFDASKPRSVVRINGASYLPKHWTVNRNGHGATDDATFSLSLKMNPDFSRMLAQSGEKAFKPVPISIWAGYPSNPLPGSTSIDGMVQRFLGNADIYEATPDADDVTFTCRSLAAPLVDQKLTSAPMNMTAQQFAQAFATALGLKLNVVLAPGVTPITIQEMLGREYEGGSSFNAVVFNMHPWDILLQCALFDDTDVWVDGNVLNYASPSLIKRNRVVVPYGSLMREPKLSHSLQLNRNIRVEVRSWSTKTRTAVAVRAEGNPNDGITISQTSRTSTTSPIFGTPSVVSTSISPTGVASTISTTSGGVVNATTALGSEPTKQIYKIVDRHGLNLANANKLAQSLWRQYSAQEYAIEFSLRMTPSLLKTLSITSLFAVSGLPYALFNRTGMANEGYYPRTIVETFDSKEGWDLSVVAVNHVLPSGAV